MHSFGIASNLSAALNHSTVIDFIHSFIKKHLYSASRFIW